MPSKEVVHIVESPDAEIFRQHLECGDYAVNLFSRRNLDKSPDNQDSVFCFYDSEHLLVGVCDGAGGHPKGKDAAMVAAQAFTDSFKQSKAILESLEIANTEVNNLKVGAKTTIAGLLISNDEFRCFSIGDSELLYLNSRGFLIHRSTPHSLSGYKVASGLISQQEALLDEDRHLVDAFLGDETIKVETFAKINCKFGHRVVVGTDGLFDNLPHSQIIDMTKEFSDTEELSRKIEADCFLEKNYIKDDDVSYALVKKIRRRGPQPV